MANPPLPPDPQSPAMKPPPGFSPNPNDAYTLQPYNIITIAFCAALTTAMVALRLFTKVHIIRKMQWEDYCSLLGYVAFIVNLAIACEVGEHGAGTHQWNLKYADVVFARQWTDYDDTAYSVAVLFTKYSILWLIKRIFLRVRYDLFYWIIIFLIVSNTIYYTLLFFLPIWACIPRAKIWHPSLPGHCINFTALLMSSAAWNVFSDVTMLVVPICMIWRLQVSRKRKIATSFVFAVGGFACAASIIRIPYLTILIDQPDYTYHKIKGVMWANTEIALGITCSCLPILPRFVQHVWTFSRPGDSETMMQMANGKSSGAPTSQKSKASKRDWVELRETTRSSTPPQTLAPSYKGNNVPTYREDLVPTHKDDLEMGRRD